MESTTELVTESVADLNNIKKEDEKKTFKNMTMQERARYVKEIITVEPLICCYIMASYICQPALLTLEYEKACKVNKDYNDTVCDSILDSTFAEKNFTEHLEHVQTKLNEVHSWQQPLQSVMPIILVLFLGSYSDRHKIRKPFLLLPLFGDILAVIGCILCVIFMRQLNVEVLGVAQVIIPSLFGAQTMIIMAAFAYIADVSTLEMRTLRIGVLQIVLNIVTPIVQTFSVPLFEQLGYIGSLLMAGVFLVCGIIYGVFWIKEPQQPIGVTKKGLFLEIFDPRHAIDTFALLVKKRKGNNREYIILIMVLLFVFTGVNGGEGSTFFNFTKAVYAWTASEFTYFLTINTVIHLVGVIVALPLFTKVMNLTDFMIAVISFIDKILCNLCFVLIATTTGLYIGIAVSIIISIAPIAIRSQATKVVSEDDLGKAQSLFAVVEAIAPAVAIPIYDAGIYNHTVATYPQAFFFLGIILYAICCIILMYMYLKDRKKLQQISVAVDANGTENGKTVIETTHM